MKTLVNILLTILIFLLSIEVSMYFAFLLIIPFVNFILILYLMHIERLRDNTPLYMTGLIDYYNDILDYWNRVK
jgi:hypothetical protein